jgi:ferredoxin
MRITIHADKCIAAGHCVTAAEDIFGQNEDDGIVFLITQSVPPGRLEAARNAARRCPTGAIEIVEEGVHLDEPARPPTQAST